MTTTAAQALLAERIAARGANLSPAEQRVVDFITRHREEVAFLSAAEIARERRLGPARARTARARTAHAWRSLIEAGARLDLVSEWPGSFNERRATPPSPVENISLAVTRAWHPEQRLGVAEAIAAYTINPTFASYEEDRKGSLMSSPPQTAGIPAVPLTRYLGGFLLHRRPLGSRRV